MSKFNQFAMGFLKNFKGHKDAWNYEDGCVLMGCCQLYEATGDEEYKEFVLNYLKTYINEDGTINRYEKEKYNIDNINSGKVLFYVYDWTKEDKYYKAIEVLMDQLKSHPRTKSGNFFHKLLYPNQIWLDGLYMAQPFYVVYETRYNKKENYNDIINQFKNVRKYLFDENKKLYYHAYDEARELFWADKETGLSKNFWLRAMGWYLMALVDVLGELDENIFEHYKMLEDLYREAIKGILAFIDTDSNLFYQVIDREDLEGNYLETSGSAMVAYSILKACRMGVLLKEKYQPIGEGILNALTETMVKEEDGVYHLTNICSVAGLGPAGDTRRDGSTAYYLSEPIVSDDHKGVGAYMMAYAQYLLLQK